MRDNTPKNAKIAAWWDYGGMINVLAERTPLALSPSREEGKFIPDYIVDKSLFQYPKLESDIKIKNIARIYATSDSSEAVEIMKEYGANYLLVPVDIQGMFLVLYQISYGEEKFLDISQLGAVSDKIDKESTTYKALTGQPIAGFNKVYSDEYAVVFELLV